MKRCRYYIFNNGRLLLHRDGAADVVSELPASLECSGLHLYEEEDACLCYMGGSCQEVLPEGYGWVDLRESFHLLPEAIYRQAGKASELLYFDSQHRYCGVCGAPMEWGSAISKRCTACGQEIWPKLNTAIIVLIHRGEEALLVKAKNFKRDFYGLVAGFVETGESLEECIAREVYEETGLRVANIRYYGSQPWPYPMGLMIGFHADYAGGDIALRDGELRDAAFFGRDNIPAIPGKMSMARMLIDDWLQDGERG
ncbi:MAG: NAD(+) diphosphatase [Bacteroidaceae bacterium]|nr:NAD(+) diphosphatase [Bacteroidaceae bacterium]